MKRENGVRDRRRDRDTYHQSCLIPDVLAHLAHATRRGGRCVCVVRLLRNGSKTKFFQQPGRFQARTRFLSHAQGERVGSLPAHALHSRRERLTIHGTAHRTTWSHPPQRHVRGCGMLPSMSVQMCNLQVCVCASAEGRMGPPTRYCCLCLVSSHPEHEYTGGWDKSWQQPRLCGSGRLTADMGRAINHPSPPGGLTD